MPKRPLSKAERWARTHARLRETAALLLRTRGLREPSVADVMRGARLTVGGFYGHWASREALFEEVLRDALRETWSRLLEQASGATPRERLACVVRRYLSRAHRDAPGAGCPLPASLGDIAALGPPYREAFGGEFEAFAAALGAVAGPPDGRRLALGLAALMVGGLALARATAGTPLSDSILDASRALALDALERAEKPRDPCP
jgi:TetR/AcrR family transcriptional regulator, transcriptional repressor for nem operon